MKINDDHNMSWPRHHAAVCAFQTGSNSASWLSFLAAGIEIAFFFQRQDSWDDSGLWMARADILQEAAFPDDFYLDTAMPTHTISTVFLLFALGSDSHPGGNAGVLCSI